MTDDPFQLSRFLAAQADSYETALAEITRGRKQSHWMWFIFPQLHGLGSSAMAERYAIRSVDEAIAYLDHPVLGHRYRRCVRALPGLERTTPEAVFGQVDAMKLHSSLTLFASVAEEPLFGKALANFYGGVRDERTVQLLGH